MSAHALQTRFARAVEVEYVRREAEYREAGSSAEEAHLRALEDAERLGRHLLDELRRRGLFPWTSDEAEATLPGSASAQQEVPHVG